MRFRLLVLFLLFSCCSFYAQESADGALTAYAKENEVSEAGIKQGLENAVWKEDRSAVAVCFRRDGTTLCVVAFRDGDRYSISDVSKVEGANFAKLGFSRFTFEKYLTEPVEWNETNRAIYTDFGLKVWRQITFRTQAWKNGQRYSVSRHLTFDEKWEPRWQ